MPEEMNLYFEVVLSEPIILILHAPADEGRWEPIYDMACELAGSLWGRIKGIYFLGRRGPYRSSHFGGFHNSLPGWYRQNKGRTALINPILEEVEDFPGQVLVVCSDPPMDIADWENTSLEESLLLVNLSGEDFGVGPFQELICPPPDKVLSRLDNPVEDVRITAPGFAPLAFEAQGATAQVAYDSGAFALCLSPTAQTITLHLKALAEKSPTLRVKRKLGGEEEIKGSPENPWFQEPEFFSLDDDLSEVVASGINRAAFTCPQCGLPHPYDTFLCPSGDIILKGLPTQTTILFKRQGNGLFHLSLTNPWYARSLSGRRLLVREGRLLEAVGAKWRTTRVEIEPYQELGNGLFALFHKL